MTPPVDAEQAHAVDVIGELVRIVVEGTLRQDATSLYVDTPDGRWRLHGADRVEVLPRQVARPNTLRQTRRTAGTA